jgi:hypothetical protein
LVKPIRKVFAFLGDLCGLIAGLQVVASSVAGVGIIHIDCSGVNQRSQRHLFLASSKHLILNSLINPGVVAKLGQQFSKLQKLHANT